MLGIRGNGLEDSIKRLLALGGVGERAVVEALFPTEFQLLATTRDKSETKSGVCTYVGDMNEEEALHMPRLASCASLPLPEPEPLLMSDICHQALLVRTRHTPFALHHTHSMGSGVVGSMIVVSGIDKSYDLR